MAKVSADAARFYLRDVSPETCFWINNGAVLKSLQELSGALKGIAKEQFRHHVNREKNDFAKWVDEVVQDAWLAKAVARVRSAAALDRKVEARVKQLKRAAG